MTDSKARRRRYRPLAIGVATMALLTATVVTQDHRQGAGGARVPAPTVDQKLTDAALTGAIDLHAHSDPDSYRRSVDGIEAATLAKARGMRGMVLKNHFTQTAGLAYLARKQVPGLEVFGGIALNTPVGGLNPEAVLHMTEVRGGYGKVVWMPTHDSEQEVKTLNEKRPFVPFSSNGALLPAVFDILDLIAKHNLVLATGHVSVDELFLLLRAARERKITRILVTHPQLGKEYTYLTVAQMQQAAKQGPTSSSCRCSPSARAARPVPRRPPMRSARLGLARRSSRATRDWPERRSTPMPWYSPPVRCGPRAFRKPT